MAGLIAELEGVVDELRKQADWAQNGGGYVRLNAAYLRNQQSRLSSVHAEVAAAVRDGRRWRFLCTAEPDAIDDVVDLIMACADKPDLDAAMDTAMRAGEGEG